MGTKLVVGLGNPGPRYALTRHNIGFMVIDAYASTQGLTVGRTGHQALYTYFRIEHDLVVLLKPQTFMNLSGNSVGEAVAWFKVQPTDVIVIYDDLDLPLGRLRLRPQGGSGGHKGLKSILGTLGAGSFPRIRVGIGRPLPSLKVEDWLLKPIATEEWPIIQGAVGRAAQAVDVTLRSGWNQAMDQFNAQPD